MSTHNERATENPSLLENAISALEGLDGLITATNGAQLMYLHNVHAGLQELEIALAVDRAAQLMILNNLEADETLEKLEVLAGEQRAEFDALDFIGQSRFGRGRDLWGWEEFHSGVVAWLLDPKQNHGYGDWFLKDFLNRAGVRQSGHSDDWSETEVTREWGNEVDGQQGYLDILVVSEAHQVLCAIENKVFSSEHSEQLTRYRLALDADYSTFARYHVFLTRRGELASRGEEREYWTPFMYSAVFEILGQLLECTGSSTNEDVRAFLRQYAASLRRNVMPETSVPQLARKIYLEHREAIDHIITHKPDWVAEFKQWLKEAIEQQQEWVLDLEETNYVRFRCKEWDRFEATRKGTGWAPRSNSLLLFQFRFYNGLPWLELALSAGDPVHNRLRQELFEAVRQHPILFKRTGTTLSEGWMTLHQEKDYILDEADYGIGWDDGTTRAKLEAWITSFATNQFPAMNEVIVNCLQDWEAEEQR